MTTTLPSTLLAADTIRTATPLRTPECRAAKQHWLVWACVGLCCLDEPQLDRLVDPRTTVDQLERHRI